MTTPVPQPALALRNIMIATDFSSCSERAVLHAVALAHALGSTLHVVHVLQPDAYYFTPPEGYMGAPVAMDLAMDLARIDAQKRLDEILHRTHCEDIDSRLWLLQGDVGETLCDFIDREHIDLAVVGTHGRTGLRRFVMGSVAEDVFRRASCPVLTVGPHSSRSDPQSVHLKQILFPTDLSADSARALPFVMAIASRFSARLIILGVVEHLTAEAKLDRARVISALDERMREMVAAIEPMRPDISFQVEFGDVSDAVIQTASTLKVDLVAFGLKPPDSSVDRTPWMHAYKIVRDVECPVLSLRGGHDRTDQWPGSSVA